MPRYDYDCANCGTRFEVVHSVFADPPDSCPHCDGGPIKKAFAPPTIHFKGSGWAKMERRATSAAKSSTSEPADGGTKGGDGDGGSTPATSPAAAGAAATTNGATTNGATATGSAATGSATGGPASGGTTSG